MTQSLQVSILERVAGIDHRTHHGHANQERLAGRRLRCAPWSGLAAMNSAMTTAGFASDICAFARLPLHHVQCWREFVRLLPPGTICLSPAVTCKPRHIMAPHQVNYASLSGKIGAPNAQISKTYPSPVTPAGFAFRPLEQLRCDMVLHQKPTRFGSVVGRFMNKH